MGGPFPVLDCVTGLSFEGGENIQSYESSAWAERGFCKTCGTHLYKIKANESYMVPVGIFENPDSVSFETQIFTDQKPDYYDFHTTTEMLTKEEALARYYDR